MQAAATPRTVLHDASHLVQYLEAYAALVRSAAVKFLDWQLGDYHRQASSAQISMHACQLRCSCCDAAGELVWAEAYTVFLSCIWLNSARRRISLPSTLPCLVCRLCSCLPTLLVLSS